jgi:hypothetical protein
VRPKTARTAVLRTASVFAVLGVALAPTAALGADIEGGLWYYNSTGVAAAHSMSTGAGVTIALVDSVVNLQAPDLAGTTLTTGEPSYCATQDGGPNAPATSTGPEALHTTAMASLLVGTGTGINGEPGVLGVAPGAEVKVYAKQLDSDGICWTGADGLGFPVQDAIQDGADIVLVTGTVPVPSSTIIEAARAGVIIVASGGNDGGPVNGEPAELNSVVATGTTDASGAVDDGSTTGERLGVVAPGVETRSIDPTYRYYGATTGSSNSAAYTAGVIALAISAFPDATANQILQALVRTTDGSLHEPAHTDDRGFGAVNLTALRRIRFRRGAGCTPAARRLGRADHRCGDRGRPHRRCRGGRRRGPSQAPLEHPSTARGYTP